MKKIIQTLTYSLIIFAVLTSCSDPESQVSEPEVTAQSSVDQIETIINQYLEEEKKIVYQYYNQLSGEEKNSISFEQYRQSLKTRYKNYSDKAIAGVQKADQRIEPSLQIEQIRQSAKTNEEIPDWYWNFQQNWKDKIVAMEK